MSKNQQLSLFKERKTYPKVSTAEKRLLLQSEGKPWPVCDCCGIPKKWESTMYDKPGGKWKKRCTQQNAENRLYYTPGSQKYSWGLKLIDERMQKYIDGTPENKEYKERIYQSWTKFA